MPCLLLANTNTLFLSVGGRELLHLPCRIDMKGSEMLSTESETMITRNQVPCISEALSSLAISRA